MKICRECGFIKSNKYKDCPECKIPLDISEECEHAEVNVNENGFLYCEVCGELVEDKVHNMFM